MSAVYLWKVFDTMVPGKLITLEAKASDTIHEDKVVQANNKRGEEPLMVNSSEIDGRLLRFRVGSWKCVRLGRAAGRHAAWDSSTFGSGWTSLEAQLWSVALRRDAGR